MQIHPAIERLRGNPAPQPHTDAVLAKWRSLPEVADVIAALARFDAGADLIAVPPLARITSDHGAALAFVNAFIGPLLTALRAEPLAQLPVGHSTAPGLARVRLATHGRSALTLLALARRDDRGAPSVLFEDCIVHEIVLAGQAQALLHRRNGAPLTSAAITLCPGTTLSRSGPEDARQITAIGCPLLMLQLTQEPADPAPSQEIAVADGAVIKTISGCKATSQQIMALGVLGALGHRQGLADMQRLVLDRKVLRDVRWEALRQMLALDARCGLAVLRDVAERGDDPLGPPAARLQRQLAETRPDLAPLLSEPV